MKSPLAQHIIDNLNTAVLWFDADLYLQIINPAAENMLALSKHKIKGLHAKTLFPERQCFQNLQTELRTTIEYGLAFHLPKGGCLLVDCSITPIRDPMSTDPLIMSAVLVELVNVNQHQRITREEKLQAQQQVTHKILRGLAHEIKNPLGGIRGAAQLLARELQVSQQEFTDIIIGETDRLQTLLNRMLGSRTPAQRQNINVHQILCRGRRLIQSQSSMTQIHEDFDPSLPDVYIDPDQIHQVLLNIMLNAVQALPEGRGNLTLRTRIDRSITIGGHTMKMAVRIDIEDDGAGVPSDMLEQIFYPMVSGRPEGTGLGLSIAQDLIKRNGGMILCESQAGKTVFTIWLPLGTSQ